MEKLRRLGRNWDWGYLVVLVLALLAMWPFLSRGDLPGETDAELHIFRLAELSRLIRGGEFYPRWAPNFYYGYGYPIFNYYAPLTYYLGLIVDFMPVLDPVDGVKAVFELGLLAAALGMYGLARDHWGREAGWVAAASYLFAPYVMYTDPHARGVLAESFSFGLFPLALWAFSRLNRHLHDGRPVAAVGLASTLLLAAIMLTHNLMAMVFIPLLALWLLLLAVTEWHKQRTAPRSTWAHYLLPFLSFSLGIGLAAFFWLPVFLEQDAINITTVLGVDDNFDFRTHFLSLGQLLGPSPWLDWRESGAVFAFNLGIPQWLLGGLGVGVIVWRGRKNGVLEWFFLLGSVGLLFLMLPMSEWVWLRIPILPYLQFPWRLLGPAAAFLAILAALATHHLLPRLQTQPLSRFLTPAVLVIIVLFALPLTQMPPWPEEFGETTSRQVMQIELTGRWVGTTSTSDFVPATVDQIPTLQEQLVINLMNQEPVDRVNRITLPAGATVDTEILRPLHFRYLIHSPELFRFRLFLFAFPGWELTLDGQPATIDLGRPEGFITTEVPAGDHVVDVKFGTTRPRTWGWLLTGLSLIGVVAMFILSRRLIKRSSPTVTDQSFLATPGWANGRLTLVSLLVLWLGFVTVIEPMGWLHEESPLGTARLAEVPLATNFGGQISLLGYGLVPSTPAAGDTLELTLFWQAQQPLQIKYQVFVHLLRADGTLVAGVQSDKLNPGDYPTNRWGVTRYVRDRHEITLPTDLPPGEYWLSAGLWVAKEGWRLPVWDENGQQLTDHTVLQPIIIR